MQYTQNMNSDTPNICQWLNPFILPALIARQNTESADVPYGQLIETESSSVEVFTGDSADSFPIPQ